MKDIEKLVELLGEHERISSSGIHLTASENTLSPLCRMPFVLDVYSRYFLDDLRLFGAWWFNGGRTLGRIEQEVLLPVLTDLCGAEYVNVRPLSGLSCMTAAMAALCKPGDAVLTIPGSAGGHASTPVVLRRLGATPVELSFRGAFDLDLDEISRQLRTLKPSLVYIDQSTQLFPLDPQPLRDLIQEVSPTTRIHYDSSHTNGLILAGVLPNPLDRGADSFGGSTHKTLPGPHKGFLATRDKELADKFRDATDHFVSHHHMASVISLAVALLELRDCGGQEYAAQTITNARLFARTAAAHLPVAGAARGYTACHQVWVACPDGEDIDEVVERLLRVGLIVNNFRSIPELECPSFRVSLSEVTRLGAREAEARLLAELFVDTVMNRRSESNLRTAVMQLRAALGEPKYCFAPGDLRGSREGSALIRKFGALQALLGLGSSYSSQRVSEVYEGSQTWNFEVG